MAVKQFNLFSDNIKASQHESRFLGYIVRLQSLLKNSMLYPVEHKLVQDSLDGVVSQATEFFAKTPYLVILRLVDSVLVQGAAVDQVATKIEPLVEILDRHMIRKMVISRALDRKGLVALSRVLGDKPESVVEAGGIRHILRTQGVRGVDIRSASFLFGSADRPDESVKLDTLGMAQTRYWEASLAKTGLDSDEFIDYLMLVPTGAKLHLREVQLAMPVLTDPEAIADLAIHLSTTEKNGEQILDAGKLISLFLRIENVLHLNSGKTAEMVRMIMGKAARLLDDPVRLAVLRQCLVMTSRRQLVANRDVFDFTPGEKADLIMALQGDDDGDMSLLRWMPATEEELGLILSDLRDQCAERAIPEHRIESLMGRVQRMATELIVSSEIAWAPPAPGNDGEGDAVKEAAQQRFGTLQRDLESGYLFVLGSLIAEEPSAERCEELRGRFHSLFQVFAGRKDARVLLTALEQVASLTELKKDYLTGVFWQRLTSHELQEIAEALVIVAHENEEEALEMFRSIEKYLPSVITDILVERLLAAPTPLEWRVIATVLQEGKRDTFQTIVSRLDSIPLVQKMNALNMVIARHDKESAAILTSQLGKYGPLVDGGILLALGSFTGEKDVKRLIAQAQSKDPKDRLLRPIAIYILGRWKVQEAIPILVDILRPRYWFDARANYVLRSAAAYALLMICTPEALKELDNHKDKLKVTYLGLFDMWAERKTRRVAGAIRFFVGRVSQWATAVGRAIGSAVAWVVRLAKAAIKRVGHAIAWSFTSVSRAVQSVVRSAILAIRRLIDFIQRGMSRRGRKAFEPGEDKP